MTSDPPVGVILIAAIVFLLSLLGVVAWALWQEHKAVKAVRAEREARKREPRTYETRKPSGPSPGTIGLRPYPDPFPSRVQRSARLAYSVADKCIQCGHRSLHVITGTSGRQWLKCGSCGELSGRVEYELLREQRADARKEAERVLAPRARA